MGAFDSSPLTGLLNLWVRAEHRYAWRRVGLTSDWRTLLALRCTSRSVLRDLCCTLPRPSLPREVAQYRSATRAWLRGVVAGHTGGCR